jgi:hypothetical protein
MKKEKVRTYLLVVFIVILMMCAVLAGCTANARTLEPPVDIKQQNNWLVFTWEENATSYIVKIDGIKYSATTIDKLNNILSALTRGEYDIQLKAVAKVGYYDSDWSETFVYVSQSEPIKLAGPVVMCENDVLTFTTDVNAAAYAIKINNTEYNPATMYELDCLIAELPGGEYNISVKAVAREGYADSEWSLATEYYVYKRNSLPDNNDNFHKSSSNATIPPIERYYVYWSILDSGRDYELVTEVFIDGQWQFYQRQPVGIQGAYYLTNITPNQYRLKLVLSDVDSIHRPRPMAMRYYTVDTDGYVLAPNGDGTATIYGRVSTADNYVLPTTASFAGIVHSVTTVEDFAFHSRKDVKKLIIPDSIIDLGDFSFVACSSLTDLTVGSGVTSIGYATFTECAGLTSLTFLTNVKKIDSYAFSQCTGLVNLYIPSNVTEVGDSAFAGCTGLTSITVSDENTRIGSRAFAECSGLTTATYPKKTSGLGAGIFADCKALVSVTIPSGVERIEPNSFSGCTSLVNIVLPNSVTYIGNGAFERCKGLSSIIIPDGVTSLHYDVFNGCTNLARIVIPDGVKRIEYHVFSGCISLTEIFLPDGVTELGSSAFSGCISLTKINIPDSVTNLGGEVFRGCTSLVSIVIPNGIQRIGMRTFYDCTSLISIYIPDNIPKLTADSFNNCTSLKTIYFAGTEARWKEVLGKASLPKRAKVIFNYKY